MLHFWKISHYSRFQNHKLAHKHIFIPLSIATNSDPQPFRIENDSWTKSKTCHLQSITSSYLHLRSLLDHFYSLPTALRKGTQTCSRHPIYFIFLIFISCISLVYLYLASRTIPQSYRQTLLFSGWKEAMDEMFEL